MPELPPDAPARLAEVLPHLAWVIYSLAILLGAALWAFGRLLARPACAVAGLAGGAGLGLAVMGLMNGPELRVAAVILCSMLGAMASWLLFRFWTGLVLAVVLTMTAPCVAFAVHEPGTAPAEARWSVVPADTAPLAHAAAREATTPGRFERLKTWATGRLHAMSETASDRWARTRPATQRAVVLAGLGGMVVGLLLGLLTPWFAASMVTAGIGSFLLVAGITGVAGLALDREAALLPQRPLALVVLLVVATALGAVVQTVVWRGRDEG